MKHPRMLVAYGMESTFTQTTRDYLRALKDFTGCDVDYLHVTHDANVSVDLSSYDVVFHNYCARLCFDGFVSRTYLEKLGAYKGLKILAVQDEYNFTNKLKAAIKSAGFDIVLTCVPQDALEYVYPRAEFPNVDFVTVLTGYVPDEFVNAMRPPKPLRERSILVGYRGRSLGAHYGTLGFDKFEIGRRMKEICDERGIQTDIAMTEDSRIYGSAWFDFVGDCRSMLGSESGSNVFDFDGSLEVQLIKMTEANKGRSPTYEEFFPLVAEQEKKISMGQISPRIFECAVMRTPMILFQGRYSDAIRPDEHYIALEKDFSNVDDVLVRLGDVPKLERMAERTYQHLVASGRFGYRRYGAELRALIDRGLADRRSHVEGRAQTATETDYEELSLLDVPTAEPATHHEFRAKRLKRRGISGAAEIAAYRALLSQAIVRDTSALHSHSLFLTELQALLPKTSTNPVASGAMNEAWTRLKLVDAKTLAIRKADERWAGSVAKGQSNRAAALQLGEYANLYDDFRVAYIGAVDRIEQIETRCLLEFRKDLPVSTFVKLLARYSVLKLSGSKLDYVKRLAKRSQTLRKWAPKLMKVLGKRDAHA